MLLRERCHGNRFNIFYFKAENHVGKIIFRAIKAHIFFECSLSSTYFVYGGTAQVSDAIDHCHGSNMANHVNLGHSSKEEEESIWK